VSFVFVCFSLRFMCHVDCEWELIVCVIRQISPHIVTVVAVYNSVLICATVFIVLIKTVE